MYSALITAHVYRHQCRHLCDYTRITSITPEPSVMSPHLLPLPKAEHDLLVFIKSVLRHFMHIYNVFCLHLLSTLAHLSSLFPIKPFLTPTSFCFVLLCYSLALTRAISVTRGLELSIIS